MSMPQTGRSVNTTDDTLVVFQDRSLNSSIVIQLAQGVTVRLGIETEFAGRQWIGVYLSDGREGYVLGPSARGHTDMLPTAPVSRQSEPRDEYDNGVFDWSTGRVKCHSCDHYADLGNEECLRCGARVPQLVCPLCLVPGHTTLLSKAGPIFKGTVYLVTGAGLIGGAQYLAILDRNHFELLIWRDSIPLLLMMIAGVVGIVIGVSAILMGATTTRLHCTKCSESSRINDPQRVFIPR